MLRVAGSLRLGTVQASELVRSFLRSERPSSLASAIMELGRINKTLYLLNYIDDAAYRRRILTQINRGEHRHRMIRAICYGRRGEIRKPYRQGQEDQLSALGLVTNAVVLWNTIYMEAAPKLARLGISNPPRFGFVYTRCRTSKAGRAEVNTGFDGRRVGPNGKCRFPGGKSRLQFAGFGRVLVEFLPHQNPAG